MQWPARVLYAHLLSIDNNRSPDGDRDHDSIKQLCLSMALQSGHPQYLSFMYLEADLVQLMVSVRQVLYLKYYLAVIHFANRRREYMIQGRPTIIRIKSSSFISFMFLVPI